ncbi:MAG: YebG family protein [Firmicutes bacterium]|nr:YebG family protein [Bacillota bacterium]
MAVITQYVVVRDGEEKMSFTSKAEADAHDKMLDMVEALFPLLEQSELLTDEKQTEDLALFLAREREQVLLALGAKKPAKKKVNKSASEADASKAES